MDRHDPIRTLLKHLGPMLPIFVWSLVRALTEGRQTQSPREERMANTREFARSVSSWQRPGRGTTRGNRPPTPSPRSDPMWDRELDG